MEASLPLVQIGMPVFNGSAFLDDALTLIQTQDYPKLEIFISDNGSTDSTREICEGRAARDPRITYIRHETNRGAAWNFNFVFSLCTADHFAWAACDDRWSGSFVRRCMEALRDNPSAALAHAQVVRIDALGQPYQEAYRGFSAVGSDPRERFRRVLMDWRWSFAFYGVFQADYIRRTRGFRRSYGADHVLLAELSLLGELVEVPEPLYFHRTVKPEETPAEYVERVRLNIDPLGSGYRYPIVKIGLEHLRTASTSRAGPPRALLFLDVLSTWWLHSVVIGGLASTMARILGRKRWTRLIATLRRFAWYRKFRPDS